PQDRQDAVELLLVETPVLGGMGVLAPRGDTGELGGDRHRAPVIGPVEQKPAHQVRVSRDEAGAQARDARALREAVEHQAALEGGASGGDAGLQQSRWWGALIEVQLRVALIGGDDEIEALR